MLYFVKSSYILSIISENLSRSSSENSDSMSFMTEMTIASSLFWNSLSLSVIITLLNLESSDLLRRFTMPSRARLFSLLVTAARETPGRPTGRRQCSPHPGISCQENKIPIRKYEVGIGGGSEPHDRNGVVELAEAVL